MSELYQRRWSVQINDTLIKDLRVQFSAKRSLTKDPNTCEITITNLSADSRKKIEQSKGKPLILMAGYEKTEAVIFSGEVRLAFSAREGADWHTNIESGDGEHAYATKPFKGSFGPGTSARDVIKAAATTMLGAAQGNIDKALTALKNPSHVRGFSASGLASHVLDTLLKNQGLDYSIQNGQLQILAPGSPIDESAVLLSSTTGLIGSPEVSTPEKVASTGASSAKSKPKIKLKSYLQPQFRCGGVVELKTEGFSGQYIVTHLEHQGDSHGAPWYSMVEVSYR